jgi:subtilisin-like proprotein convertase family protein
MQHLWKFGFVFLLFLTQTVTQAQTSNPWSSINETTLQARENLDRKITPQQYKTLALNTVAMRAQLAQAPLWHTSVAEYGGVELTLPMPDGSFARFKVVEAPVMHPDLQKKYPEIRTYAGVGIDDPSAYFRGDFTLRGFHGMIRSPLHSTVYIDPFSFGDIENYQVYYRKDFSKSDPWACNFDEVNEPTAQPAPSYAEFVMAGDCVKRTYALALACTGEYAAFHGGTVPLVASAFTTSMARVNGVFEQDISVTMVLVANNNNLIYLNAATDPYTNTNGGTMLGQNQTTCDNVIGNANYDIGHVFSTGGGGVAYLGSLCNSRSSPIGDPFDIDYVAHEMGHQFGANHTFNSSSGSCNGNGNTSTAYEPGSGTTIMAYAGICSPNNVQNNSDDFFHAISIQEMSTEITSGTNGGSGSGGNTCSTNTSINNPPTANAGLDYTIPKSTAFILSGTGTDPNGHPLTYTWEQMDLGAASTTSPTSTQTTGPVFRCYKGTSNPSRYLPRLTDVLNNVSPTWEVLPSVGRTLNFRLTVRDFLIGGSCTAEDNMIVTVDGTAGPFLVTSPNTAVSWQGGVPQTITWNVAGTNVAPINCANVDILLSTDGGLTYPTTLATATPNDGSHLVTLPNISTTTARIMVRGNGNIFYDISNTNFTITITTNGFAITPSPTSQTVCSPTSANYGLTFSQVGSFSGNVNLTVSGLPLGATASFTPATVAVPGGTSNLSVNTTGATPGTYSLTITGTNPSGTVTSTSTVGLVVNSTIINSPVLSIPANLASGLSLAPTLTWVAIAGSNTYQVQVSTSNTFTTTVVNASGLSTSSYAVPSNLSTGTTYFWRVRASNNCVTGPWSPEFQFTTGCITNLNSTNVPVAVSASGTPTITSTLAISGVTGNIVSFKLKDLNIHHTWVGDLRATLTSPTGIVFTLFDRPGVPASTLGCENNHLLTTFDAAATQTAATFESACNTSTAATPPPYAITGTYQPVTSFSSLVGTSPNGTWTLTVQDLATGDGGSLQTWGLEFATSCNSVLTLSSTYIEGYMNGGVMRPVLLNSGVPGATSGQCDTITVALHAATSPFAQVQSVKVVLGTTGAATVVFPPSVIGNSYYLVIKGRNLLETWSADPVSFSATTAYSFNGVGRAFGSNLGTLGGIPVLYSGDLDALKDGNIDLLDYPVWENQFNVSNTGYQSSDLNGDGLVNALDYQIWEAKAINFISVKKP